MANEKRPIELTWADVTVTATDIARQVRAHGTPDLLVGVLRGGLVPAVLLSHVLGVRAVRVVEVAHTVDDSVGAAKSHSPQVVNKASLGDLTGLDVLLVDDIAGSGDTHDCTVDLLIAAGAARVRTAILTVNRANWHREKSPADTVTYLGDVVDRWVVFPWETSA